MAWLRLVASSFQAFLIGSEIFLSTRKSGSWPYPDRSGVRDGAFGRQHERRRPE
jgi:hypothetical protein